MPFSSTHQSPSLFQKLLHLTPPWSVADVALDPGRREMEVRLRCDPEAALACPSCGAAAARYGAAPRRRWRHLDTQDCKTYVWSAPILQVLECPHGVKVTASMYPASVRELPLPGPDGIRTPCPHHMDGLKGPCQA